MKSRLTLIGEQPADLATTGKLVRSIETARLALKDAAIEYVHKASAGTTPEKIRAASELSGIPRGVLELMVREAGR